MRGQATVATAMAKRSQTEKDDNRGLKTLEVVNTLKESITLYTELVKVVQKHTAAVNATIASGRAVTEVLNRLADQTGGDIGGAIRAIAEAENSLLDRSFELTTKMTEQLVTSYIDKENGLLNADKQNLLNFAKNYKTKRWVSPLHVTPYSSDEFLIAATPSRA